MRKANIFIFFSRIAAIPFWEVELIKGRIFQFPSKEVTITVGDRMLLRMQDFDFFPNLIKFYQIHLNLPKFAQMLLKLV